METAVGRARQGCSIWQPTAGGVVPVTARFGSGHGSRLVRGARGIAGVGSQLGGLAARLASLGPFLGGVVSPEVRVSVRLPPAVADVLDAYVRSRGLSGRAAGVRLLLHELTLTPEQARGAARATGVAEDLGRDGEELQRRRDPAALEELRRDEAGDRPPATAVIHDLAARRRRRR